MSDLYRHYKGGRYRGLFYARESSKGPGDGDRVLLFHARESTNGNDEGHAIAVYVSLATGDICAEGPNDGRDRMIYVSLTTGDVRTRDAAEFDSYVETAEGRMKRFAREVTDPRDVKLLRYRPCDHCGHKHYFELSDDDLDECPRCGGELYPIVTIAKGAIDAALKR